MFGNIHTLNLTGCDKITDKGIKHLINLHTLGLYGCINITDEGINMLGSNVKIIRNLNVIIKIIKN